MAVENRRFFGQALALDTGLTARELSTPAYADVQNPARQRQNAPLTEEEAREDRAFVHNLTQLSLPIALQSLISAAVSCADVLALSTVNERALSAVSLAGQIIFVLSLLYMGLSTGLTILGAQYWGKRDASTVEKLLGLSVRLSMLVSAAFFVAAMVFPGTLMRLFTPDEVIIAYAVPYLRIVSVSFLATGASQMVLTVMKCMGQTKASARISAGCLAVNTALNLLAVLVLFPGHAQACVAGVAAATTLSRLAEAALALRHLRRKSKVQLRPQLCVRTEAWLMKDFRACTWKVQANYLIWGGSLTAMSAIMGRVGAEMVSAYAVANAVRSLVLAACTGLAAGSGILLGAQLGTDHPALARHTGDRLLRWSLLLGAAAGVVLIVLRPLCLTVAALPSESAGLLDGMLWLCAVYCVGKSFNSTLVSGIFCAGGDTRFGLICDTVVMWGVILPLGCLCAFVWKLLPLAVFAALSFGEFIKMPFAALHFRKGRWVNNLTKNTTEE